MGDKELIILLEILQEILWEILWDEVEWEKPF